MYNSTSKSSNLNYFSIFKKFFNLAKDILLTQYFFFEENKEKILN